MLDIEHFIFLTSGKSCKNPPFAPCSQRPESHQHTGYEAHFTATLLIPKLYSQLWQTAATTSPPPHALLQWGLPTSSGRGAAPALESGLALTTHL